MWKPILLSLAMMSIVNAGGMGTSASSVLASSKDPVIIATNSSFVQVPYRPEVSLRDISVHITMILSPHVFNPTHLYWNTYGAWMYFWKLPQVTPINDVLHLALHQYPALGITIEPIPGNNRLTTAVAQAVLGLMLLKLTNSDTELSPALFQATLATKGWPSIPIGRIRNTFTPGLKIPGKDGANTTLVSRDIVSRASTNKTSIVSNGEISVWLEFNGQDPRYPRITPKVWLHSFTSLSTSIFSRFTTSDRVFSDGIHRSIVALSVEDGPDYRLFLQVVSIPTPAGKVPLVWEELAAGLLRILYDVIREQRFESFDAFINKDGRLAATCVYYYAPKLSSGQGNVTTA
ncbi:MAG: hypothetical protein Q9184_006942 [Pyrenodesmia sp. 2 TL-2023]